MNFIAFLIFMLVSVSASANSCSGNAAKMSAADRATMNANCLEVQLYKNCPRTLLEKNTKMFLKELSTNKNKDPAAMQEKILRTCETEKSERDRAQYFVDHMKKSCPATYDKKETKEVLKNMKEFSGGENHDEDLLGFRKAMLSCDNEQLKKVAMK